VLTQWNSTVADYPRASCVHELFEAQAEQTPNAAAVRHGLDSLSYRELNTRANQLAYFLRRKGVGPEALVGIRMDRSIDMVVGLLGVLKAGGAYLPLDPNLPADRLLDMLGDAQPAVLLTQKALEDSLPAVSVPVVCVDAQWPEISEAAGTNPEKLATAANMAYVIYTSGSTGQAKGVMVEHRSVVNYIEAAAAEYNVTAADRVLQFASLSFDAHAEEIYPCLARGGTLVLRTDSMLDSYEGFFKACGDRGVTVLSLPTAYWHELTAAIEARGQALPPCLRLVVIGGEAALPERVAAWLNRVGRGVRLLNTYGPTEATVVATVCQPDDPTGSGGALLPVPIGRPLRNTRVYVLDAHRQPVPVGVPGELYIGGDGVARGYLNRPELTAERFLPDPAATNPASRLYRTGDLVRWRSDGQLEFVGRTDQQVKIRGFRVEPGEVDAVLSEHPALREAVVVAGTDSRGAVRLIGYVVPHEEPAPPVPDLRNFLKRRLPAYMVPATFVPLPSLPRTASGKVDRPALPAPSADRSELQGEYVAPRSPTEARLAMIWAELLKLDRVSVNDNFFDLGGHSLLAVQMVSRVRTTLAVDLPLVDVFTAPTVAELAERVQAAHQRDKDALTGPQKADNIEELMGIRLEPTLAPGSPLVPLQPKGTKRPFFCVHGAGGHCFALGRLAKRMDSERPFFGLRARGLEGKEEPHERIEDMAAFYLDAIRGIQPQGPYFIGGWSMGTVVAYEMAQQLSARGEEVALLVLIDPLQGSGERGKGPSDEGNGPLKERSFRWIAGRVGLPMEELQALPAEERMTRILEHARSTGMIHPEATQKDFEGAFRTWRTNRHAARVYKRLPNPNRTLLLRTGKPYVVGEDVTEDGPRTERMLREFCSKLEVQMLPGGHLTVMREPHVETLGGYLTDWLNKIEAASSSHPSHS
jgi:aspartate racemase